MTSKGLFQHKAFYDSMFPWFHNSVIPVCLTKPLCFSHKAPPLQLGNFFSTTDVVTYVFLNDYQILKLISHRDSEEKKYHILQFFQPYSNTQNLVDFVYVLFPRPPLATVLSEWKLEQKQQLSERCTTQPSSAVSCDNLQPQNMTNN